MPDDWESFYHLDPDSPADASADPDGDGMANLTEFRMRTNPTLADPATGNIGIRRGIDDDGDGLPNWFELTYPNGGQHPNSDLDGDGLSALMEYLLGSNPEKADTDEDGLNDFEEATFGTDPTRPDTDMDGLFDGPEVQVFQTAPLREDTDGDGAPDGLEVDRGTDPKDPQSTPERRFLVIMGARTEFGPELSDGWEKQTKQFAGAAKSVQLGLDFPDPNRAHVYHLLRVNAPADAQRFEQGDHEGYAIVEFIQVTIAPGETRSATNTTTQDGQFFHFLPVEITVVFGIGPGSLPGVLNSRERLEGYLESVKIFRNGNFWFVKSKDADGSARLYVVEVADTEDKLLEALGTECRTVIFDGHANFGLGPNFSVSTFKTVEDFTNFGVNQTDIP